jgi:hypothetical protein
LQLADRIALMLGLADMAAAGATRGELSLGIEGVVEGGHRNSPIWPKRVRGGALVRQFEEIGSKLGARNAGTRGRSAAGEIRYEKRAT